MNPPKYQYLGGTKWRAWFGDWSVDVTVDRERSYPGLQGEFAHRDLYQVATMALWQWATELDRFDPENSEPLTVLDAGCGSGYGIVELSFPWTQVQGVDVHGPTAEFAGMYADRPTDRASIDDLSLFDTDTFDAVINIEAIEHVDDDAGAMAEMGRVLKPDGFFFCSTPLGWEGKENVSEHHIREYSNAGFKALLEAAGYKRCKWWTVASHTGHMTVGATR